MRDRTRRLNCMALMVAISVGASIMATAAQGRGAAQVKSSRPGWDPRGDGIQGSGSQRITTAERAILEARFAEYERLFATPDSLRRPQGFLVRHGVGGNLGNGTPNFGYQIIIAPDRRERPPALWAGENPKARDVWLVDSGPPTFKDADGDMYVERPKSSPLPGMPPNAVVFDGLKFDRQTEARINSVRVLLTADGELPWADVPRERVLRLLIAEAERVFKITEQQASETTYQRWLREAPQRQRDREQILAGVASGDKTQVAKAREDLERAEREIGESHRKSEANEREVSMKNLAFAKGRLSDANAVRANMSAAERAMPAWIRLNMVGPTAGTYTFAAPGTPGFDHLIADKPEYYRFKGSRVQARALLLYFHIQEYTGEEAADRAVADSFKAFDWTAAARLLTPSAKQ